MTKALRIMTFMIHWRIKNLVESILKYIKDRQHGDIDKYLKDSFHSKKA